MTLDRLASDCLTLAATTSKTDSSGISWDQYLAVAIALAVLVLPFIVGGFLAKTIKMPSYSTRLGWVLLALTASVVVLISSLPKLGVDLRGGTILVYEIDPSKLSSAKAENRQRIKSEDLIEPLTRRINPSGTQEIVIRPYGDTQIEIIVPEVDQREVDRIKGLVEEAGILRFAIVANQSDHSGQIGMAEDQASSDNIGIRTGDSVENAAGETVAFWAEVDREDAEGEDGVKGPFRVNVSGDIVRNPETGQILRNVPPYGENGEALLANWVDQQEMKGLQVLMIRNPRLDITGEDLAYAASTFDQNGAPAVAFNLTDAGSSRFFALTTNNAPVGSRQRQLGIVLDDALLSAPNILQPIRKEGRITGRFTREEVDSLVQILKAGQLPAALTKQPIAENAIDATLGADTIRKGVWAISGSLLLVLLFILTYYRFTGVIACIALVMNLGMIMATMVLINQPLTLPGLAGLVLTVGMSVDANVLIFERIREELKKGAAARMAIRNGFAKASVTIVDANLTTLITAIVLYAIGTDQIRGFAVTLILGILFSMFTAIYVSRTLFDIAERHGFLSLSMADGVNSIRSMFASEKGFDFIGKGRYTLVVSAILIVIGIGSLFYRGKGILDIDFAGGSSVQFRLDKVTPTERVREIVESSMVMPFTSILVEKEILTLEQLETAKSEALNKDADLGETLISRKLATAEQVDDAKKSVEPMPYTVNGVSIDEIENGTVFKVDSAFERVEELQSAIVTAFAKDEDVDLVTYSVTITPADGRIDQSRVFAPTNGVMLTVARAQEADVPAEGESAAGNEETADENPESENPESGDVAVGQADSSLGSVKSSSFIMFGIDGDESSEKPTDETEEKAAGAAINAITLTEALIAAATSVDVNVPLTERTISLKPFGEGAEDWTPESSVPFSKWQVDLSVPASDADKVMAKIESTMGADPVWISSSSVGARVAGDMIGRAFGALFASLICIIGYIWFRFQRVLYGFAAVAALLHDVLITLGAIAVSYWLAGAFGFLLIDQFKISLTVVAAILTIIGYSLNDTIVVFDRIRETKGKAPKLTGAMINASIDQTLSRTLLTSLTTLIVVLLLYWFGGEGIHAFAFALVIGVIAGTYSSIFIASPILLWLIERGDRPKTA